jgi:hypothetical protein
MGTDAAEQQEGEARMCGKKKKKEKGEIRVWLRKKNFFFFEKERCEMVERKGM